MNRPVITKSLTRIINRYVAAFGPERIVLFGSYAKGTNKQGSDMDLLIITGIDIDFSSHLRRARQLAADCFPRVDVVFVSNEEVKRATLLSNAFLLSAIECGIILYQTKGDTPAFIGHHLPIILVKQISVQKI